MEVVWRLGYLLALLAVGLGFRHVGVLNPRRVDWLNALAFWVALPALVFSSTYDQPLADLVSPGLVVGMWVVMLSTVGLAYLVHSRYLDRPRRGVAVVQSYHSNLGYLGLPLVAATMSVESAAIASVVLGIGVLTQVPVTVIALIAITDAEASIADELKGVATNPVLASLLLGLAASTVGLTLPGAADAGLSRVADLALPLALLCVGGSLDLDVADFDLGATGSVLAFKIGWMPLLAWVVFSQLNVAPAAFAAVVVMLGTPTAVSTFVYANELGGDARFASVNVFATTLVSVGTLFGLVALVQ